MIILILRRRPNSNTEEGAEGNHTNTTNIENGPDHSDIPSEADPAHPWGADSRVIVLGRMRSAFEMLMPLMDLESELLNMVMRLSELTAHRQGTPPASKDALAKLNEI